MGKPLECISVVVITYNSEETVLDTLESIKNQTYGEIELIVTDDASTDNTVQVVQEWFEKNKERFKRCYCRCASVNKGVSNNANEGVACCTSSAYKLIAGDDVLLPEALSTYYEYFVKNPDDIYVSKMQLLFGEECTEDFRRVQKERIELGYSRYKKNYPSNKKLYREMLQDNCVPTVAVGLIKKETYLKIGRYDERFPLLEDYPFYINALKKKIEFGFIDKELVGYRIHQKSICLSNNKQIVTRYDRSVVDFFFKDKWKELIKEGLFFSFVIQLRLYGRKKINIMRENKK